MVKLLVNVGAGVVFAAVVATVFLAIRRADSGKAAALGKKQFALVLLALVLMLLKFASLGDTVLITGQTVVIVAFLVYGWWSFWPATPRSINTKTSKNNLRNDKTEAVKSRRPRRRKLAAATLLALLVAVGAAVWVLHSFNTASQGTLETPAEASTAPAASAAQPVSFSGKHFSFSYMNYFSPSQADPAKPPMLESYSFVRHVTPSWQLNVQVESLPSGNLEDDGSYHFRSVNPGRFTNQLITVNGTTIHLVTDNDSGLSFSKAAYLQHKGLLATVALSGGSSNDADAMQAALSSALNSWQWKQ